MAQQLADPTVTLLLTARSEDRLKDVAHAAAAKGAQTAVYPQDLAQPGAAAALFDRVRADGFVPSVLINNAGFGKKGAFEAEEVATYEAMITLNNTNLVSLTRLCLPGMLDAGQGGILNVASTAAYQPLPFFAVYGASKAFVLSFSEALHEEYARRGITVTCLSPGSTQTAFHERSGAPTDFLGPQSTPEDVARDGLRALRRGKRSHISGWRNAVGGIVGRIAPRAAALKVSRFLFGPKP
jgi:short-subunit dehydrogenase